MIDKGLFIQNIANNVTHFEECLDDGITYCESKAQSAKSDNEKIIHKTLAKWLRTLKSYQGVEECEILDPQSVCAADRILASGNRVEILPVKGGAQVAEIRRKVVYRLENPIDTGTEKRYNMNEPD